MKVDYRSLNGSFRGLTVEDTSKVAECERIRASHVSQKKIKRTFEVIPGITSSQLSIHLRVESRLGAQVFWHHLTSKRSHRITVDGIHITSTIKTKFKPIAQMRQRADGGFVITMDEHFDYCIPGLTGATTGNLVDHLRELLKKEDA